MTMLSKDCLAERCYVADPFQVLQSQFWIRMVVKRFSSVCNVMPSRVF